MLILHIHSGTIKQTRHIWKGTCTMGDIELQIFADRLKELRIELKLTQKEFSEKTGITAAALSSYENNQKNPSISVLKRIAEAFNVSADWLCGLSDNKRLKNEITTYGEMLELIKEITDISYRGCRWQIGIEDVRVNERYVEHFLTLTLLDPNLVSLFKDWEKMQALFVEEVIDKHLYDLWVSDRCNSLKNDLLDPDLPFDDIPYDDIPYVKNNPDQSDKSE